MKSLLIIPLALMLTVSLYSQNLDSVRKYPSKDYEHYMKKSKNLKTAGWILLGGGVSVGIAGLVIGIKNLTLWGKPSTEEMIGGTMFFVGAAADVASVPVFISAGSNKRKAMRLGVTTEAVSFNNKYIPNSAYPALSLKIGIGK